MNLDTTKLSQSGSKKLTPHDNCTVLDLDIEGKGASVWPRLVEIRIPGIDGARQSAIWDGTLDLAVNDVVIADEFAGQTAWKISGMGGNDSGIGKTRVNSVWALDFTSKSLITDASDNVTINTGTLTLPSDIIHLADTDTKISFTDDDIEATVGGISMLKLTEAAQDIIALGPGSGDIDVNVNGDMFLEGSSGDLAIGSGTALNYGLVSVVSNDNAKVPLVIREKSGGTANLTQWQDSSGTVITSVSDFGILFTSTVSGTTGTSIGGISIQLQNRNATVGNFSGFIGLNSNGDNLGAYQFIADSQVAGTGSLRMGVYSAGSYFETIRVVGASRRIGFGVTVPAAKLDVDQGGSSEAIPVLRLDQGDVSEEMIEFATTIGTGNAIEAKALKVLTPTHFIKVTIPGGLSRYLPVGTIATTGPVQKKSATVSTQGLGANPDIFAFGFYEWTVTDIHLSHVLLTQTFGTANVSYAAHAFVVTAANGTVNTGVIGLRVNGTSINDQGTRTTSDTETIIADITAAGTDGYHESAKKWLGQVTFELFTVSGSPTVYGLDINYGLAKYDDWFNIDFTITSIEAVGFAGANDSNFDVKLMHHQVTGWTYHATAFTPITAANTIASLVTDHGTDDQLLSSQHVAWKRDNLSTAINGSGSEGFLVFISSSANNSIEYLNFHVGVVV